MIQNFTAHTINCVCHSIRSMFRVLGMYNFDRTFSKFKVNIPVITYTLKVYYHVETCYHVKNCCPKLLYGLMNVENLRFTLSFFIGAQL